MELIMQRWKINLTPPSLETLWHSVSIDLVAITNSSRS
jgi:hypothetical protein